MTPFQVSRFRSLRRSWRIDPGLLLAVVLALMAALPFLTRPGLPRGTDAELHVFRAAELGYALRWDNPYPRWAPHFYYGYGYPIFNYYAPLTYYLANLFHLLPGVDIVAGVKLVFVLGLVAAGVGMFLFGRERGGPRLGLVAAALYVFSPYVLFVDPHMRGVLAESFSLGLLPVGLWLYSKVLSDRRRRWLVAAVLLQAAVILAHNLMAVVITALYLGYLAWEWGAGWRSLRHDGRSPAARATWSPALTRAAAAFVLGVGLSAIFWLPVALEQGAVHLNLTGPGHFDFHNHFLTLGELLAPSTILDMRSAAPHFAFNLGLPQWPLALLALPVLFRGAPQRRSLVAFLGLVSLVLIVLMLPVSAPVWERVPGMRLLQFPWRLLGPAAAMLSVLGGLGVEFAVAAGLRRWRMRRSWRWETAGLGLVLACTLFLALPTMYPPLWRADFGPTDPRAMVEFELTGTAVGTTSTGDFVPKSVEILPHPEPAFLATITPTGEVDKVNRATLPAGTRVASLSQGPNHDRYRVVSSKPFILRLFTFYFPGWRATIDGQEVPIELGRPEGFITVPVPAGTHTVEVRLGAMGTPARAAGTVISLFSLLIVLGAVWWRPRGNALWAGRPIDLDGPRSALCGRSGARVWVGAASAILLFFVFKVGLVDRHHNWFRFTSPSATVQKAQFDLTAKSVNFGGTVQLLAFDLPRREVRANDVLPLTLYWQATGSVPENYQVFAHLTQPITHLWGQSDNLNPGEIPTTRWTQEKYVRDDHELRILPGTPPGEYQITVGLYTLQDGVRVPLVDGAGVPEGDTFTLPISVRVLPPRRQPSIAALQLTDVIRTPVSDRVTLLGAVLQDRHIELPGFIHLALLWQADADVEQNLTVQVQLVNAQGEVVEEIVTPPVDGRYPTSVWSAGEVVRDPYSFWLTDAFVPGEYELRVGLREAQGWISLGSVQVVAP
jgi:hypothetical protein